MAADKRELDDGILRNLAYNPKDEMENILHKFGKQLIITPIN